jgi:hypothetical protein
MRLPDGEFVWGLGDDSTTDLTVQHFKEFARRMYASYMGNLDDTNVFTAQLQTEIGEMQDKLVAGGELIPGQFTRGVLDLDTEYASGFKLRPPPEPVCVYFSVNGAGSTWSQGYPYDIGQTLDSSKCWHQPIGYDTTPFPMMKGVATGVNELVRQLNMPRGSKGLNCTVLPWTYGFYSMGAIVGMTVLMRVFFGDLQQFKHTYMGGITFGNPMRQHGHTFPGCTWNDGEGIVTPNAHGCPDAHWDFADDAAMPGSGGDDLYTKIAKAGTSAAQNSDMRSVWNIIATGNPLSLTEAIFLLLLKPSFTGGYAAAKAAFQALDFFVVHGINPHTNYQFSLPIQGDSRNCWELAREHIADLVARLPIGAAG